MRSRQLGTRFWQLFAAAGVSSLGDGLVLVAFPLLAVSLTSSTIAVAAVVVVDRLPVLLFGLAAGAFADRMDRRALAITVDVARLVVLAVFAGVVASGHDGLAAIYVTAFLLSSFQTVFEAATISSLPAIVADGDLERANGWLTVADIATEEVGGQAVGGALVALATAAPFVFDALSFAASAILLRRALPKVAPVRPTTTIWADIRFGLRWFNQHRVLRRLVVLVASFAFCQSVMLAILVVYGTRDLHLSRAGYGLLLAVGALGTLIGAVAASPVVRRLGTARSVAFSGLAAGAAYVLLASEADVVAAAVALGVEAVAIAIGNVATLSLRQREVPNHLLGRVTSAFRMFIYGAMPLGALLGGIAAALVGVRATFALAGIIQLLVLAAIGLRITRAED